MERGGRLGKGERGGQGGGEGGGMGKRREGIGLGALEGGQGLYPGWGRGRGLSFFCLEEGREGGRVPGEGGRGIFS